MGVYLRYGGLIRYLQLTRVSEMDAKDYGTGAFISHAGEVPDGDENPLWVGNSSAEDAVAASSDNGQYSAQSVPGCASHPTQFSGGFQRPRGPEATRSATRKSYQRQDDDHTTAVHEYVEKFAPINAPFPVRPAAGYYPAGGRSARRLPPVLPEYDLSYRPGSLQEAICMYIDYLMDDNEARTCISECAVASPTPPLDFHREEYYRDVMCRSPNTELHHYHHYHGRVAGDGRRVVAPPCPRPTARLPPKKTGCIEQVIAPVAARRHTPHPADGSSTHGGSTSICGRFRRPHVAKLQAASVPIA